MIKIDNEGVTFNGNVFISHQKLTKDAGPVVKKNYAQFLLDLEIELRPKNVVEFVEQKVQELPMKCEEVQGPIEEPERQDDDEEQGYF